MALAVTSRTRLPVLPDAPTLDKSGLPGFESAPACGFLVPAGTPEEFKRFLAAQYQRWRDLIKRQNIRAE